MISSEQLAEHLGCQVATVRKYARQNLIPAIKLGKDWKFQSLDQVIVALAATKGNKLARAAAGGMR